MQWLEAAIHQLLLHMVHGRNLNTLLLTIGYSTQLARVMALTMSRPFKQVLRLYCVFDVRLS